MQERVKDCSRFNEVEKAADRAMTERLREAYATTGPIPHSNRRNFRNWKCLRCHYVNGDRLACANCLELRSQPGASQLQPSIACAPVSCESDMHLFQLGSRYYRTYNDHHLTARPPSQQQAHAQETDQISTSDGTQGSPVTYSAEQRKYIMNMACPAQYHRFIVGPKGQTLKDIQRRCDVRLIVPKPNEKLNHVVIEASLETSVRRAESRILSIIADSKKSEFTHFVSVPLCGSEQSLDMLRKFVSQMKLALIDTRSNVDASLFQSPEKMHLTLIMLSLPSDDDIQKAKNVLESLEPELQHIFDPADVITLKGLQVMQPDVTAAHVLYMNVERNPAEQKLQRFAHRLATAFSDVGVVNKIDSNELLLHVTVMNSKYRHDATQRTPFNASRALHMFGNTIFGSHRLTRIEISRLSKLDNDEVSDTGFYLSEGSISFP